jgi:hypothetical protein
MRGLRNGVRFQTRSHRQKGRAPIHWSRRRNLLPRHQFLTHAYLGRSRCRLRSSPIGAAASSRIFARRHVSSDSRQNPLQPVAGTHSSAVCGTNYITSCVSCACVLLTLRRILAGNRSALVPAPSRGIPGTVSSLHCPPGLTNIWASAKRKQASPLQREDPPAQSGLAESSPCADGYTSRLTPRSVSEQMVISAAPQPERLLRAFHLTRAQQSRILGKLLAPNVMIEPI